MMSHIRSPMRLDQEAGISPYESPIVVLSVGPKDENPTLFNVHKEKLVHIPFFKAALREDAFIEGQQGKIEFEEEDPILFRRVVEFLYQGDYFPRQKQLPDGTSSLELSLKVKGTTLESEEEYIPSLIGGVLSGTLLPTTETHLLFAMVVQLLCLADRYGMEDLVKSCFQKLKHFPIGVKEVTVLAQHVVGKIPETRVDIHEFLADQVRLHLPRLNDCAEFRSLLEGEMSILGQGLVRLVTTNFLSAQGRYLNRVLTQDTKVVVCVADVTVEGCIERYGSDDSYPIKFGAARAGEIFTSDGTVSSRYILCARRDPDGPSLAFPASSFRLLVAGRFSTD